ncbi:putative RNA 2'-phosphotransferase [Prauserella marina]|uniref:Probable RNA 2'-phosphotransferase n=1 Tax=Prauserella marina TaxID=530584 RepID=A0A1G6MNK8_9PSEU|nr:putative RNA 2'-phosphotransferase [Prauserella marina]SDC57143.1 putative RNA 2'-phosphotransferase [Prauserella marina]
MSKRLSLYLRHAPERIGIQLDEGGWVEVDVLLAALAGKGIALTRAQLNEVVVTNDKRRFAFDHTGTRIRANQGHSVAVELDLPVRVPPALLYHGTVAAFLPTIRESGLLPMKRHDVHLSATVGTARTVGSRRGEPVVLTVDAAAMTREGHEFRLSANGVWLAREVPPRFLSIPTSSG